MIIAKPPPIRALSVGKDARQPDVTRTSRVAVDARVKRRLLIQASVSVVPKRGWTTEKVTLVEITTCIGVSFGTC
jgi:hypothetical protein